MALLVEIAKDIPANLPYAKRGTLKFWSDWTHSGSRQRVPSISFSVLVVFIASIAILSPIRAQVQQVPTPPSTFEVASVRMVEAHSLDDLTRGVGVFSISPFPANLLTVRNVTLGFLMQYAFNVDSDQIAGKPSWLDSQQYDISAKVEGNQKLTRDEMLPLLQHLLEQRFNLTIHRESKTVSGYELVVAKGGPRLQPDKEGQKPRGQILPNGLQAWGFNLDALASMLRRPAERPVTNKTGISGTYDIELDYASANDPNSTLPDLFTALQEELGLKLVPQRIPVEILVIDHVDRVPTEN
jgi:uncharacterized protein (TIGR03435 family)